MGAMAIVRWPKGNISMIEVPPHSDCKIEAKEIVASFHTHPNTGADFVQEPSESDKRAVRDDPDLKAMFYAPKGEVLHLGSRATVLET